MEKLRAKYEELALEIRFIDKMLEDIKDDIYYYKMTNNDYLHGAELTYNKYKQRKKDTVKKFDIICEAMKIVEQGF